MTTTEAAPALPPRTANQLNHRQARFAKIYAFNPEPAEAYAQAGYDVTNAESVRTGYTRLLRNVAVLDAIDRAQKERIDRLSLNGDWVIVSYKMVYLNAMKDKEYASALKALDSIGRCLGVFREDNFQKRTIIQTAEQIKADLKQMGFDVDACTNRSAN